MANNFVGAVMADTNTRTVIRFCGEVDAVGETANTKISGRMLKGALATDSNNRVLVASGGTPRTNYRYTIERIFYSTNFPSGGYLKLYWDGATPSTIALLNGTGDIDVLDNMGSINNTATTPNGNVGFTIVNPAANGFYNVILELRKDLKDYDAGQVEAPQAFNVRLP